ncbi:uncharacterized protein LY89DRAFT_737835 [Mollisia scopiformis]|uniref:Uncharacterized protein n=1 Tax=Mollisia scopiformis TaxID=149040 RepID=A0A194WZB2_MOLSC|nr:uncharacterized protein LY89DRAFT_737835 [Mollisia scopiformis]KUJ12937.1 hypothetical protein LY89DRAFT_737835 [Mollisia scopiformis]
MNLRLEDALRDFNTPKAVEILESSHNLSQNELNSALRIAISSSSPDTAIDHLLSHGAQITETVFYGASARKYVISFQAFLDHGWDINSLEFGQPALRLAVGDEQLVRWFLDHDADPNLQGTIGCSILATAALHPSTTLLEPLISRGAQV